jgi:hypothetical protein
MKNQRFAAGSAATPVVPADPILLTNQSRSAVVFSLTGAFPVFVWPRGNGGATDGLQLNVNTPVLSVCACDYGPAVPSEWYAWSPGGASSVAWIEIEDNDPKT